MKRSILVAALGIGFAMAASAANAQVTPIADFDAPYPPTSGTGPGGTFPSYAYANYGAWADPGATNSLPTYWETNSTGYGSNFFNIYFANYGPTVDISSDNTLQLNVDVVSGTAGFLVDLYDGEGGGWQYQLGYGYGPGNYTLDVPLDDPSNVDAYEAPNPLNPTQIDYDFGGLESGLDLSQIISYHLELDPGSTAGVANSYDVYWEGLGGVSVPEPASLGMGAVGCMLFLRLCRR